MLDRISIFKKIVSHVSSEIFLAVTDILERIFPISGGVETLPVFSLEGYKFVRLVKQSGGYGDPLVEEFVDSTGTHVMVKTLRHRFPTSSAVHMLREAKMLSMYPSHDGQAFLPKLYGVFHTSYSTSIVMGIIPGASISASSLDLQKIALLKVIGSLRSVTSEIGESITSITTVVQYIFAFPYYFVRVFLKKPELFGTWAQCAIIFFKNIFSATDIKYAITHYDLNQKNIHVLEDGSIGFFDFGRINLAPQEVEIALLGRHYRELFQAADYLKWLRGLMPTMDSRRFFLALTSYHGIQDVVFSETGSESEAKTIEYLGFFLKEIVPRFL